MKKIDFEIHLNDDFTIIISFSELSSTGNLKVLLQIDWANIGHTAFV